MKKKSFCIVSGSRADYDLLKPVIRGIKEEKFFKLFLLVTGSHLSKMHGFTYKQILKDGFKIDQKIEILRNSDKEEAISKSISRGIVGFTKIFKKIKPDAIIVLGDRYEIFSAVISAAFFRIPIIHLHGGETSEGSIDEIIRHSISKFSNYHFVATKEYKKRVIQLGESPKNVFNVGSTGPENIRSERFMPLYKLEKELNFNFKYKNLLITYHPVTYEEKYGINEFKTLLKVLSNYRDVGLIFTMPNADAKNNSFIKAIKKFTKKYKNSKYFISLGQKKYFSCVKYVDAVIGNSSSGLIEVPSFNKPTINLGKRQRGRIKAQSVIDCEKVTTKKIQKALNRIYNKNFIKKIKNTKNPYANGATSRKIIKKLKSISIIKVNEKKFNDLKFKIK